MKNLSIVEFKELANILSVEALKNINAKGVEVKITKGKNTLIEKYEIANESNDLIKYSKNSIIFNTVDTKFVSVEFARIAINRMIEFIDANHYDGLEIKTIN